MSAVVQHEPREMTPVERLPLAPAASESAAILTVIERMAMNPHADPDRIERYMDLYERMESKKAEQAFNAAMTAAQIDMGPVAANQQNSQTHSRYADYYALDKALRPIYTKHGFALSFNEADSPKAEHVRVECIVSHVEGFSRTYHRDIPADGKGAKGNDVMTKTHAAGAAQSYAMRYLLRMIFNVAIGEDDRDGNLPAASLSEKQAMDIRDLIERVADQVNANRSTYTTNFLKFMKVERVEDIAARDYQKAITAINSTRTRK